MPQQYLCSNGTYCQQDLFDQGPLTGDKATTLQHVPRSANSATQVYTRFEVALAAGDSTTPHLLELSGLGPKTVSNAAVARVQTDMLAAGVNTQDHTNANMQFGLTNLATPNQLSTF